MKWIIWNCFAALAMLMLYWVYKPEPTKLAPIVNAYAATPVRIRKAKKKTVVAELAPEDNITVVKNELSLDKDPRPYAGKKIAVTGMLWAAKSYEDYMCGMVSSDYPCTLRGGPLNPKCEYIIQVIGASTIYGCVPRSKAIFLAQSYVGETVTVIGTVDPKVEKGAYPWLRDSLVLVFLPNGKILNPYEQPSEKWEDKK